MADKWGAKTRLQEMMEKTRSKGRNLRLLFFPPQSRSNLWAWAAPSTSSFRSWGYRWYCTIGFSVSSFLYPGGVERCKCSIQRKRGAEMLYQQVTQKLYGALFNLQKHTRDSMGIWCYSKQDSSSYKEEKEVLFYLGKKRELWPGCFSSTVKYTWNKEKGGAGEEVCSSRDCWGGRKWRAGFGGLLACFRWMYGQCRVEVKAQSWLRTMLWACNYCICKWTCFPTFDCLTRLAPVACLFIIPFSAASRRLVGSHRPPHKKRRVGHRESFWVRELGEQIMRFCSLELGHETRWGSYFLERDFLFLVQELKRCTKAREIDHVKKS